MDSTIVCGCPKSFKDLPHFFCSNNNYHNCNSYVTELHTQQVFQFQGCLFQKWLTFFEEDARHVFFLLIFSITQQWPVKGVTIQKVLTQCSNDWFVRWFHEVLFNEYTSFSYDFFCYEAEFLIVIKIYKKMP